MIEEETNFKGRLLNNLESNSKLCIKLSKEMGVRYDEPDPSLSLLSLQKAVKAEAKKLEVMKDHIRRMEELKFDREEQFINMKETILSLYEELEEEPFSDMERDHLEPV